MKPSNDTAKLALTQWTRSAAQHNVDALVKVGDYYYHGLGVSEDSERLEKAARYYQSAADTQLSALAMWNLGWMYENGVGLPQVTLCSVQMGGIALVSDNQTCGIYRTFILRSDIMTRLWTQTVKLTCLGFFRLLSCIFGAFGIPSWEGRVVLNYGHLTKIILVRFCNVPASSGLLTLNILQPFPVRKVLKIVNWTGDQTMELVRVVRAKAKVVC